VEEDATGIDVEEEEDDDGAVAAAVAVVIVRAVVKTMIFFLCFTVTVTFEETKDLADVNTHM
jgi:hypothetical protein